MKEDCLACGRCPKDKVLAAAKRILCKEYQHKTYDELDLDANLVSKKLMETAGGSVIRWSTSPMGEREEG